VTVTAAARKTLDRTTFSTSRMLEYFTDKELTAQIGHPREYWPVAVLRELIDNALDACEMSNGLPEIEVTVADDRITVADNGPGLPAETLKKSLDYMVRVSDKAHYVSPTRGAMGNAMKVVYAAAFVDAGSGFVEVATRGKLHRIEIVLDRIAQRPDIKRFQEPSVVKIGTSVSIRWPDSSGLLMEPESDSYNPPPSAKELLAGFMAFNPHATFLLNGQRYERTDPSWKKWRPDNPTSPHWYTAETLRDLIAAYITKESSGGSAKTVREFVSEFRGLSATAKQKTVSGPWSGKYLSEFVTDGDIDREFVRDLLKRMQGESSPPPPLALGPVGKAHLSRWMTAHGVSEKSIQYIRKVGVDDLPFILEVAFGVNKDSRSTRRIVTGLNWSPVIGGDPDPTIRNAVAEARLDPHDPVTLLVHISRPRFAFADRGKTRLAL
jgi:DNA topoisomerase VI subunit B